MNQQVMGKSPRKPSLSYEVRETSDPRRPEGQPSYPEWRYFIRLYSQWLSSEQSYRTSEAAEVAAFKLARKLGMNLREVS